MDRDSKLTLAVTGTLALAGMAVLLWAAKADAHEAPTGWVYPALCCSGKDCNMLPVGAVKETPNGFVVTVLPGQHDFIKEPTVFQIPYGKEKLSPDGRDHLCISEKLRVLCFFTGPRGF